MTSVTSLSLEARIKAQAFGLGFDLVGICALGPAETAHAFDEWIANGYAGTMDYLARGRDTRQDSSLPVPGTTSAIVVAMNYGGREPAGPVARYARGEDYHDVMLERLRALHRWLDEQVGYATTGKAYVDTGPVLERDLARRAGLGWFGKNTNLINPSLGSFFFLGTLLLDVRLAHEAREAAGTQAQCRSGAWKRRCGGGHRRTHPRARRSRSASARARSLGARVIHRALARLSAPRGREWILAGTELAAVPCRAPLRRSPHFRADSGFLDGGADPCGDGAAIGW